MSKRVVKITHMRPIDALFDKAKFTCTVCGAAMGACDCWEPCPCGWTRRKGEPCNNPECTQQRSDHHG